MSETTIRQWLTEAGFDFARGVIHQATGPRYWGPALDPITSAVVCDAHHPILDQVFDSGYGSPECPRFIAKDETATYFPEQYDGRTELVVVRNNIMDYLDYAAHPTPYPGGS